MHLSQHLSPSLHDPVNARRDQRQYYLNAPATTRTFLTAVVDIMLNVHAVG